MAGNRADMAFLRERFEKETREFVTGRIIPTKETVGVNSVSEKAFLIPEPEEGKKTSILFRIMVGSEEKLLRLEPDTDWDPDEVKPKDLYFISTYDIANARMTISYIPMCLLEERNELEVLFDADYVDRRNKGNKRTLFASSISNQLERDYVFDYFGKKRVFVKRIERSDDLYVFGVNGRKLLIKYNKEKQKYFLDKDIKGDFPKDHNILMRDSCLSFFKVRFCEESNASPAFQEIVSNIRSGKAILGLWSRYSEMELKEAEGLKEKLGNIPYKVLVTTDSYTRVQLSTQDKEQIAAFRENADELSHAAMEVVGLKLDDDTGRKKAPSFKVKSINRPGARIDFFDEDNLLPNEGQLCISIVGDTTVSDRRVRALELLTNPANTNLATATLLRTLALAIEGDMANIPSIAAARKRKKITPTITKNTQAFLKERFGIDHLTENQEMAVELALNTPDLAIIQGPPGTGKSTVIAAICNRLIEEASHLKEHPLTEKIILLSAFQNDTVEHIASKIDTLGLPTIKAGKDAVGNIRAEDDMIALIRDRIDAAIHRLPPEKLHMRTSAKLVTIRDLLAKDLDYKAAKGRIEELLRQVRSVLSDELWGRWQDMFPVRTGGLKNDRLTRILRALPEEPRSYGDGGYNTIQRLLVMDNLPLDEDEIRFLDEEAPMEGEPIPDGFLERLRELKYKYLSAASSEDNTVRSGVNLDMDQWIRDAIRFFSEQEVKNYEDEDVFTLSVLSALRDDLEGSRFVMREAIKEYSQSLAATNQVAGGRELMKFNEIENVILEEAARSNPLDLLIPIIKATRRIILVGDQKQLPQLIETNIVKKAVSHIEDEAERNAESLKFEDSLFKILFDNLSRMDEEGLSGTTRRSITLEEQFRMHPAIGDFISRLYYGNRLKPGMGWEAQESKRQHCLTLPWAVGKVAVFCDVPKDDGFESGRRGKARRAEARRVISLLDELGRDSASDDLSIGIITFYSSQVDMIFEEGLRAGYTRMNKDGDYEIAPDFLETRDHREKLRIGSVDSFQGKEFDIVILSTVRCNDFDRTEGNERSVFGFLTLFNRLNVAFSRAQRMIIVVGDGQMFDDEYAKTHVEGLHEFYTVFSRDEKYGNHIR